MCNVQRSGWVCAGNAFVSSVFVCSARVVHKRTRRKASGVTHSDTDTTDDSDDATAAFDALTRRAPSTYVRGVQRGQPISDGSTIAFTAMRDISYGYKTFVSGADSRYN
jgi:hypothetical protein